MAYNRDGFVHSKHQTLMRRVLAANEAYYENDEPIMTDAEFDSLMHELRALEAEFPFLLTPFSPTQQVGGKASSAFEKVPHRIRMESLDNTFTPTEVAAWAAKHFADDEPLLGELKMDGLSLSLIYEDGLLMRAVTRGDGTTGEDVTHTAREIVDLPQDISAFLEKGDDVVEVRGEVYMTKQDFADYNEMVAEGLAGKGAKPLANCRNGAAGTLRQKDAKVARKRRIRFMAFGVTADTFPDIQSDAEVLDLLEEAGFDVVPRFVIMPDANAIEQQIEKYATERPDLPFDIDGIVFKVDDRVEREGMGSTSRAPRWATAYKFPAEKKHTTLLEVIYQVGRTGAITPVGKVEPVQVGGVVVSSVTLHNEDEIDRLGLQIGDVVEIQRAGDVIPQITRVIGHSAEWQGDIAFPKECPSCGGALVRPEGEAVSRCTAGFSCEPQLQAYLEHFVSRDAMDIDGLGPSQIEDMIRYLGLSKPSQIMKLPEAQIMDFGSLYLTEDAGLQGDSMTIAECMENWEGYGKTSVKKLMAAIKKARKVQLDRFIYALGIRNIGKTTARDIAKELGTVDAFFQLPLDEGRFADAVGHVDGIGPVVTQSFEDFCNNDDNYAELFALRLTCEIQDMPANAEGPKPLSGEVICFTGGMDRWSRDQCLIIAEELGAKTTNAAAKKTTVLVAGANVGAKKIEAAEKHGCRIESPEWFYGIVEDAVSDGYKLEVME